LNLKQAQEIKKYIMEIDSVLGFIDLLYQKYRKQLSELINNKTIKKMLSQRTKARNDKDYKKADKIRIDLLKKGIVIEDTEKGCNVRLLKMID